MELSGIRIDKMELSGIDKKELTPCLIGAIFCMKTW